MWKVFPNRTIKIKGSVDSYNIFQGGRGGRGGFGNDSFNSGNVEI